MKENMILENALKVFDGKFVKVADHTFRSDAFDNVFIYAGHIRTKRAKLNTLIFAIKVNKDGTLEKYGFNILPSNVKGSDIKKFCGEYIGFIEHSSKQFDQKILDIIALNDYSEYSVDAYGNLTLYVNSVSMQFNVNESDEDIYTEAVEYVLDNTEDENKIYDENNGYVIVEKNAVNKQIKNFLESKNDNTSLAKFYRELKRQGKIYANNGNNRIEYRSKGKVAIGIAFILGVETNDKA